MSLCHLRMIINIFVCFQEAHRNKVPTGDGDNAVGDTRQKSKNRREKRTKSNAPVAKQLRKRTSTVSRRNSERSSPITSARTVAKVGRRRATYAASGATGAVRDNEADKSDTEVDDDDNTEQESSSDGAEDSLTLADVKKGLDEKGKHAGTFTESDDAVTANVALAKSKCGRQTTTKNEQSSIIDATTVDSDVSCGDTHVIKTNIENSDEEKKAPNTRCTELVDEGVTIESRVTRVSAEEDKPANVPSPKCMEESLDISNGSETTISDEPSSHIFDGGDSPILETDSGKGTSVENGTESMTPPPSVDVSCLEDDVTAYEEKLSTQFEAINAHKSPSALGCRASEEEAIGAAAAAPQTNQTTEETEPVNVKTTPDDADSANERTTNAHTETPISREKSATTKLLPRESKTQTDDDTEQDIAEVASSENHVEILRLVFADWRIVKQSNYNNLLNCVISVLHCDF